MKVPGDLLTCDLDSGSSLGHLQYFFHSPNKLLSMLYAASTVLDSGNTEVNKTGMTPALM